MLLNGDAAYPAMLAAIDDARHRITFESFIYSDGEASERFTTALTAAAARGVDVRIVLDSYGAGDLPDDYGRRLAGAGVQVQWFNPFQFWTLEETNYRTHRKVMVVDGRIAYTGGLGIADQWLGNAGSPKEWRDTQFEIRGPAVRALEACFYENWIESGGTSAPLDPAPDPIEPGSRSLVLWSNPTGGASNVKLLYLLSLAAARQTIDIQSPYFVLDESTRGVLDAARARGVRVRILTEGEETDAWPVKHASRAQFQALLEAGYEIWEYQPTMMHVKAVVVDGTWSIIGSANFDNRSFELNDEVVVAVGSDALAGEITRALDADLTRAQRIDAATWPSQRSPMGKAKEQFWRMFGEVF
jgi:cardiolipin synthase